MATSRTARATLRIHRRKEKDGATADSVFAGSTPTARAPRRRVEDAIARWSSIVADRQSRKAFSTDGFVCANARAKTRPTGLTQAPGDATRQRIPLARSLAVYSDRAVLLILPLGFASGLPLLLTF